MMYTLNNMSRRVCALLRLSAEAIHHLLLSN